MSPQGCDPAEPPHHLFAALAHRGLVQRGPPASAATFTSAAAAAAAAAPEKLAKEAAKEAARECAWVGSLAASDPTTAAVAPARTLRLGLRCFAPAAALATGLSSAFSLEEAILVRKRGSSKEVVKALSLRSALVEEAAGWCALVNAAFVAAGGDAASGVRVFKDGM